MPQQACLPDKASEDVMASDKLLVPVFPELSGYPEVASFGSSHS